MCMPSRWIKLVLGSCVLMGALGAHAGLFSDDEARQAILDLRQKVDTLRADQDQKIADEVKRSTEEAVQLRRSLLDLQNQLEESRADVNKLRGQNEQIAKDLADTQRKLKDVSQALGDRIGKLEPERVTSDGVEFAVDPAEKRNYESAFDAFRKQDFGNAENLLAAFVNRYPSSGYRAAALFWLGNAQYANRNYKDAVTNFRSLVSQFAQHMRTPDALLAIANCQIEMKDMKSARKTLDELVANYPATEAAATAKDRLTRFK